MEGVEIRNFLLGYLSKDIAKTRVIDEDALVILKAKQGDKEAITKVINNNIRLVVKFVSRFTVQNDVFIDLINEGCLGILKAIKNYDFSKGVKFSSYASIWIKHQVLMYLSSNSMVKLPVRKKKVAKSLKLNFNDDCEFEDYLEKFNMSLNEYKNILSLNSIVSLSDDRVSFSVENSIPDETSDIDKKIENEYFRELINDKLSKLSPKERFVIERRYGLNNKDQMKLSDIAKLFNSTPEGIRYIEKKALKKLKVMLSDEISI
ncbi:MAG: sigma-70 family RNA polymerase sigma factor [Spirochaetia bacterium]|nr:sigma-70 family RNA polymerase sigma factor [Spirochaetota bacterium]MCX8096684.1 sigma-70 family RNA polymerase sigma factor [Spirochaetota bacterium]MDW8113178.1 sigma-70 family RNA polymerase sigma factor [Spirochaetia bacterium]